MVAGIVLGAAAYFASLNGGVAVHVGQCVTLSEISDKMAYPNFYIIPTNRAIA